MARSRPGLEQAVCEILQRHGREGKRLSFRQAERLTGLSPATIGELAKGNARTAETLRRFAQGLNEDGERLLLLAGFTPEADDGLRSPPDGETSAAVWEEAREEQELNAHERACLLRWERALCQLPPGADRNLWSSSLLCSVELLERFAARDLRV